MWEKRFAAVVAVLVICFITVVAGERGQNDTTESRQTAQVTGKVYGYEKTVALTFDDGPHSRYTKELLEGLRERGVKATFFVVGENIEGNEDIIKQMYEDGHVIGNHTYSHVELTKLSKEAALLEIEKTNSLIEKITGEPVKYIRPPCGSWKESMLYEVNMTPVFWNVDPMDWCTYQVSTVVNRIMNDVEDGDIILFHDIYDSSVAAALEVVDRLLSMGYVFVTVDGIIIE